MAETATERHWQGVHESKAPEQNSWFEPSPEHSLRLIEVLDLPLDAAIVDVGGGTSHFAGELLARGYEDVTVTDVSEAALERAQADLGQHAGDVTWVAGDIRTQDLGREFDLWHDRAVFHFQVEAADRDAYLASLRRSLASEGGVVVATFGPAGPTSCSGLPVRRYGADELDAELGDEFDLTASELLEHITPSENPQQFLYAVFRRTAPCADAWPAGAIVPAPMQSATSR